MTYEHQSDLEGITTVESWVKVGEQDKSKHYGYDLPDGTWFVSMKVDNEDVWKDIKKGGVKGLSIEGVFVDKMEQMSKQENTTDTILKEIWAILKKSGIENQIKTN